jgi:Ca2+-binding RTX toxin-like protein
MNIINGTSGNDTLVGTSQGDTITGKEGNDRLTGGGNQDTFVINLGDGTDTITDFGGVGLTSTPSLAIRAEVDTIQFQGTGLTARNMLLFQNGRNLEITFEGIGTTKVILQNFTLQNLENVPAFVSNPATGNIIFNGQTSTTDSYDVFSDNFISSNLFNRNTVTFLNRRGNNVSGFDNSDDVINGQGGSDTLDGKSGNDLLRGERGNDRLRGGIGNDTLLGGDGRDTLEGGLGSDILTGGRGNDLFVLAGGEGADTITDFSTSVDKIGLAAGLSYGQLTITQGSGSNLANSLIALTSSNELLAILSGVRASTLNSTMFVPVA